MPHELIQRPGAPLPQPIRACAAGPHMRWALKHGPKEHKKKQAVLALIASYADAGVSDPAIRELSKRSGLPQLHVSTIVDWLERQGFLTVERGVLAAHSRNKYHLMTPTTVRPAPEPLEKGNPTASRHSGSSASIRRLHQDSSGLESVG